MNILFTIVISAIASAVIFVGGMNMSASTFSLSSLKTPLLGAFTEITTATNLADFPTTYNANLNKTIEVGTTSVASITTLGGLTSASALATIGTITTGVWNGTAITVANGGTGATTLTGLLQGNGTSAITAVTGTIGQFPYYSGTSALTATSSVFVGTNERVGISSTTPQRTLSVGGAVVATECNLTDGATVTFNLATCNQGRVILGGNRTLDFTNETQALGQTIRFVACQDGTGSRTITWDSAIRWAGGSAPTLTTTANRCDVIAGFTTLATTTMVILLDKVLNF